MLDRAQLDNELNGAHQANFVRYAIFYTPLTFYTDNFMYRRSLPSDAPGSAALMTAQRCRLSPTPASPAPLPSSRSPGRRAIVDCTPCSRRRSACAKAWAPMRSKRG